MAVHNLGQLLCAAWPPANSQFTRISLRVVTRHSSARLACQAVRLKRGSLRSTVRRGDLIYVQVNEKHLFTKLGSNVNNNPTMGHKPGTPPRLLHSVRNRVMSARRNLSQPTKRIKEGSGGGDDETLKKARALVVQSLQWQWQLSELGEKKKKKKKKNSLHLFVPS